MKNGPLFILFSLHGISHTQLRYWCVLGKSGLMRFKELQALHFQLTPLIPLVYSKAELVLEAIQTRNI
jgi:hypothetical protein